jgi:hypothetical protein
MKLLTGFECAVAGITAGMIIWNFADLYFLLAIFPTTLMVGTLILIIKNSNNIIF